MDIDLLSKMVKELILDKDEVALPGVGVFVAEIMPSTFSDKGYTINPPYRRLTFRQRNNPSDTSLVDFYAKSNNVSTEDAEKIVIPFLSEMKNVLMDRKTIIFPGLGRLRATKENNFFFVADEDLDIYPYGFGLEPISLKTHVETPQEVSAAVSELKEILDESNGQTGNDEKEEKAKEEEEDKEEERTETVKEVPAPAEEPAPIEEAPAATEETHELPVEKPMPAAHEPVPDEEKNHGHKAIWRVALFILAAVAILIILFVIFAHLFPDLADKLLYSPEELEILHPTSL